MWNASRCAVRLPMPGSLPSSVTRRWTGGASRSYLCRRRAARLGGAPPGRPPSAAQPAETAQAAERVERRGRVHAAHPGRLALQLHRLPERLVDRGEDHVLQHLDVLGVDRVGLDLERLELEVARHDDLDHAAAGRGLDALVLELLLRGHHVFLHLLRLLEQRVRLGGWGIRTPPRAGSSSASNSRLNCSTSSSSERVGGGAAPRRRQRVRQAQRAAGDRADRGDDLLAADRILGLALVEGGRLGPAQRQLAAVECGGPRDLHQRVEPGRAVLQIGQHRRPQLGMPARSRSIPARVSAARSPRRGGRVGGGGGGPRLGGAVAAAAGRRGLRGGRGSARPRSGWRWAARVLGRPGRRGCAVLGRRRQRAAVLGLRGGGGRRGRPAGGGRGHLGPPRGRAGGGRGRAAALQPLHAGRERTQPGIVLRPGALEQSELELGARVGAVLHGAQGRGHEIEQLHDGGRPDAARLLGEPRRPARP